jgi:hypothetical protein
MRRLNEPSTILTICQNESLSETRRLLLTKNGYQVTVVTDFRHIEKISQHPNCVVMGIDIEPRMKRAVAVLLEKRWPGIPILEINILHPEIEGAACVSSDSPEEVVAALKDLLSPTGRRYTENLHRQNMGIRQRATDAVQRAKELATRIGEQTAKAALLVTKGRRYRREAKDKREHRDPLQGSASSASTADPFETAGTEARTKDMKSVPGCDCLCHRPGTRIVHPVPCCGTPNSKVWRLARKKKVNSSNPPTRDD